MGIKIHVGKLRHQDGGLEKNLAAKTSGITTIFPIQMTINNKITIFDDRGVNAASCYVILVFHFNPRCWDRIWTSKLVIGMN